MPGDASTPSGCLGLITARRGSRGLPDKHLRPLGGRPLIDWTFHAALESTTLTRTILSTDDERLVELAVRAGVEVPFRRPPSLATDDASHLDVVRHTLDWYRAGTGGLPEAVVLLQPTSPFRTGADIDGAVARLREGARAVVGVAQCQEHPDRCYILEGGHLRPYGGRAAPARRQDLPLAYRVNGALYVIEPAHLLNTAQFIPPDAVPYVMPIERSVDVDTEMDLMWAAFCLQSGAATRP